MKTRRLWCLAALAIFTTPGLAQDRTTDFSGFYLGLEGGTVSYNTQITFDGVDDPAGRSGATYGAFLGFSRVYRPWLAGAEVFFNLASEPGAYTFDPAVTGFSEMDVHRGVGIGLDAQGGYIVFERILLYAALGASFNEQSVRIDGVPLDEFEGGSEAEKFVTLQVGAGLAFAVRRELAIRVSFRSVSGRDLDASDFGPIPIDASLTRFDVEPRQQQFLAGLIGRF